MKCDGAIERLFCLICTKGSIQMITAIAMRFEFCRVVLTFNLMSFVSWLTELTLFRLSTQLYLKHIQQTIWSYFLSYSVALRNGRDEIVMDEAVDFVFTLIHSRLVTQQ